jgi:SAM-dependent methyltransferase
VSKWPWVPTEERREPLRQTFETAADLYDTARPDYPAELFDDVVELAGLEPGAQLLEIGCATGKATRPFLERGFAVTCVELGAGLAELARRNLAGLPVTIDVAPFESWDAEPASFDLVFAATAWHWIDPQVRYEKAHRVLRPDGHLAFWSAAHAFPAGFDPFFTEIQEVYDEIGESHGEEWPPPSPDDVSDDAAERARAPVLGGAQAYRRAGRSARAAALVRHPARRAAQDLSPARTRKRSGVREGELC